MSCSVALAKLLASVSCSRLLSLSAPQDWHPVIFHIFTHLHLHCKSHFRVHCALQSPEDIANPL